MSLLMEAFIKSAEEESNGWGGGGVRRGHGLNLKPGSGHLMK